jgi:hypothetical protein
MKKDRAIPIPKSTLEVWSVSLTTAAEAMKKGRRKVFGTDPIGMVENIAFIIDQYLKNPDAKHLKILKGMEKDVKKEIMKKGGIKNPIYLQSNKRRTR